MNPKLNRRPLSNDASSTKRQKTSLSAGSIGNQKFEHVRNSKYFIDKSFFIKEFLDCSGACPIITAPRRFGKSTNLRMLRYYLELQPNEVDKPLEDRKCYQVFKDLKVNEVFDDYKSYMGKYPIIFLTFKTDATIKTYDDVLEICRTAIRASYDEHSFLLDSPAIKAVPAHYSKIYAWLKSNDYEKYTPVQMMNELKLLPEYLSSHYGMEIRNLPEDLKKHYDDKVGCFFMVDEYDSLSYKFSQKTGDKKLLNECVNLTMGLIIALAKEHPYVVRSLITGVSEITCKGLSGPGFVPYPFLINNTFGMFYGVTEEEFETSLNEIRPVSENSNNSVVLSKAKSLYHGYSTRCGYQIYNTHAVVMFLNSSFRLAKYWSDTSFVVSFSDVFKMPTIRAALIKLLAYDGTVRFEYKSAMTYEDLHVLKSMCNDFDTEKENVNTFLTFLMQNGYLSLVQYVEEDDLLEEILEVKLPNKEVHTSIKGHLYTYNQSSWKVDIEKIRECGSIFDKFLNEEKSTANTEEKLRNFKTKLQEIVDKLPQDQINESYLHAILLFICWEPKNEFGSKVITGVEKSSGFLDLMIYKDEQIIIIEAKYKISPAEAVKQIINHNYLNIQNIRKYFPSAVSEFLLVGVSASVDAQITLNYSSVFKTD